MHTLKTVNSETTRQPPGNPIEQIGAIDLIHRVVRFVSSIFVLCHFLIYEVGMAAGLSVEATARFSGNYGLHIDATGTTPVFVQDDSPSAESNYRARFYLRADHLVLNPGTEFNILSGYDSANDRLFGLILRDAGQTKHLTLEIADDGGQIQRLPANAEVSLEDDWHALEIFWRADPSEGSIALWLDGIFVAEIAQIANGVARVDSVKLGKDTGLQLGGYFEVDDYASVREEFIGLITPLFSGLNLYSFPGEPNQLRCSQLTTMLGVQEIRRFDAASQAFVQCNQASADFLIEPGEGYLVVSQQAGSQPVRSYLTCPVFDLDKGTNVVGVNTPKPDANCYSLLQLVGDSSEVATIQRFDRESGRFESCGYLGSSNLPGGRNYLIRPGEAYFVNMRSAKTGITIDDPNRCP